METTPTNVSEAQRAATVRPAHEVRGSALRGISLLLLGVAIGASGLWFALRAELVRAPHPPQSNAAASEPAAVAPKPLYHCPMHPSITSDKPANCPICGMKLVQVTEPPPSAATAPVDGRMSVSIDPARQQMIGLRTATVTRGEVGGTWRTVGRVAVDPTRVRKTHVKVDGYVVRVFVSFVGQPDEKGEPLFSLYSPTLLVAQNEYVLAGQSGATALRAAARRKLELWDVPAKTIDALEQTGPVKTLTVYSPIRGTVTAKNVNEGSYLEPGAATYEITDLDMVWVMVDAYESDVGRVRVGMQATMTLPAYPHRVFSGKVKFVAPLLDPNSRTLKVHLHFANPTGELKPELYGEVTLRGVTREGLRIPLDAVIHSGTAAVVFVAEGDGKFRPAEVQLGQREGDQIEVLSGLDEGVQVVTRANFLVDSESQLRASLAELAGH